MQRKLLISLNVVVMLVAFGLILMLLGSTSIPAGAQAVTTPTATPNPTIGSLEGVVATQQAETDTMNNRLIDEERDRKYYDRDLQWKWGISAAIATAVIGVLAWVGKKDLNDLQKNWERSSQKILDKAIYKLDLSKLPIYLPMGENLDSIHRLLQRRKFEKIGFYNTFDEIDRGLIIVSLKNKNETERAETLQKLLTFISARNPSSANTGFIIFAPGGIQVPQDVMNCHDNLVTANYPATVVGMIFVVGRGMDITPPEPEL